MEKGIMENNIIDQKTIESHIYQVLCDLYKNDFYLIKHQIHEQAIAYRFAYYYETQYKEKYKVYNFDVEWNRNIDEVKSVDGNNIRPDFIIHQRGTDENNLLVIEFKKNDGNKKDCEKLRKLKEEPYHYRFAASIIIEPDGCEVTWVGSEEKSYRYKKDELI